MALSTPPTSTDMPPQPRPEEEDRRWQQLARSCARTRSASNETLDTAARKMRDLHVGSLPICDTDDQLHGIITDRDIVMRCIAADGDPRAVTAGQLAGGMPVWVNADSDVSEVLRLMEQHAIRRLPVIDNQRLVGMISEADLATHLGEHEVAQFASTVYSAPPNS